MMMNLEETIQYYEERAEAEERRAKLHLRPNRDVKGSGKRYLSWQECAKEHRQLAEWLKRLKRIEDYIADGKDDIECTYSLRFYEIEAVMNGEIWRSDSE